jgi:hypothetical protein
VVAACFETFIAFLRIYTYYSWDGSGGEFDRFGPTGPKSDERICKIGLFLDAFEIVIGDQMGTYVFQMDGPLAGEAYNDVNIRFNINGITPERRVTKKFLAWRTLHIAGDLVILIEGVVVVGPGTFTG